MAAFSGASGSTTSMKSPAPMPGSPITRMMRPSRAQKTLSASRISRRRNASSLPSPPAARAGAKIEGVVDLRGRIRRQHQATLVAALEGDGAHLGRTQQLGAQRVRHDAAGHRLGRQRGELGGGEAVVQPADAEVGDRGHEDQHLGQHHETDGQQQQLGGQAERRAAPPLPTAETGCAWRAARAWPTRPGPLRCYRVARPCLARLMTCSSELCAASRPPCAPRG